MGASDHRAQRDTLRKLATDESRIDALPVTSVDLFGKARIDAGESELAEKILRKARQRFPGDLWINFDLAESISKAVPSRHDEAIRYFTAAHSLNAETAHRLAHALQEVNRTDEAIQVFHDLCRIKNKNAYIHLCFAALLSEENGETAEAIELLERAVTEFRTILALHPNDEKANLNLGWALTKQSKWEEAIAEFGAALRIKPSLARANFELGIALEGQGKLNEAVVEYNECLRLEPGDHLRTASVPLSLRSKEDWTRRLPNSMRLSDLSPATTWSITTWALPSETKRRWRRQSSNFAKRYDFVRDLWRLTTTWALLSRTKASLRARSLSIVKLCASGPTTPRRTATLALL